jgi:hypothetical protein
MPNPAPPTQPTLWILRSPMPSLIRNYCRLHSHLNLPLSAEIQTCNDLLLKDALSFPTLIHTSTDIQPTNCLPLAGLARERGWLVKVIVLLPSPEDLARFLKQPVQVCQGILSRYRRHFPIPVDGFQTENHASGYFAPEPDMFSKLATFRARLLGLETEYPHLGGVFEDLLKEFDACLE